MHIGELYLDNYTLFISLVVVIATSSLYNSLENKRLLHKVNSKLKEVNTSCNHNIQLITNILADINKSDNFTTDNMYAINNTVQEINKNTELITSALYDDEAGMISDISSLKDGLYNSEDGLVSQLSEIQKKLYKIEDATIKLEKLGYIKDKIDNIEDRQCSMELHYSALRNAYTNIEAEIMQMNNIKQKIEEVKEIIKEEPVESTC